MNCEKCHDLLSDFIDGTMNDNDRAILSSHLEECLPCFNVHAELNSIVSYCQDHRGQYDAPPNEHAMWLRVRNTIESGFAAPVEDRAIAMRRESWWLRTKRRSWEFSLPQMATAVVALIVFASLATVVALRGFQTNSGGATADLNGSGVRPVALASGTSGAPKERLWQQQQINYLTNVVEQNKVHWNPQVRADFERNLTLLDESVNESLQKLSTHPHDDVTEEMLNSALNDKMQLLREFSDL